MVFSIPAAAFLASALLACGVIVVIWPRRRTPGATELAWLLGGAAFWSATAGMEVAVQGTPAKVLWSQISYGGIASVPVFYLRFTLQYTRSDKPLSARAKAFFWAMLVAIWSVAWTNPLHHALWKGFAPVPGRNAIVYIHGWAFFAIIAIIYVTVVVAALLLLLDVVATPSKYRGQLLAIVFGSILPLGTSVMYVAGASPLPGVDPTPIAFIVSGVLFGFGLVRYGLFDLVPVARGEVFERLEAGVVVLDASGRVIDMNRCASQMFGTSALTLGMPMRPPLSTWVSRLSDGADASPEIFAAEPGDRAIELRIAQLRTRSGVGRLLLARDVTVRQRVERELVDAKASLTERVRDLEQALDQVTQLQQLLPICSYCRRIRSDQDYWIRLETYLTKHSEIRFSHGICPECYAAASVGLPDERTD